MLAWSEIEQARQSHSIENYEEGKGGGCGTIGDSKNPYPIAYNFFTSEYQQKVDYHQYIESGK